MGARKRGRHEMEANESDAGLSTIDRLRNMWEFANLMQYLYIFGRAVKIEEDLDIEMFETECLHEEPSEKLTQVGLALLKFVSSHRGLTIDMFDEYTRRQYQSRMPSRNPFGKEETPLSFQTFDIFSKRVEPTGWDSQERTYFVMDDNRLYRQTEPPPTPPAPSKPKKNSKRARAIARASKRRKLPGSTANDSIEEEVETQSAEPKTEADGLGGWKWECVAVTADEYRDFLESIRRSRDPDEKMLHGSIREAILPLVEKAEEEQLRKALKKERELLNSERLATAKRSSRIAGKLEKQKEEEEAADAERRRRLEHAAAQQEQVKLQKREKEREARIETREARMQERLMRRIAHEQELASLAEGSKKIETGAGRMSERQLRAEVEKRQRALEEIAQESDWMFDCSGCGLHGENVDDGSGIISCEKCQVWQHLGCLGFTRAAAERSDFHFVCNLCQRRMADKEKSSRKPIKLDFRKLASSSSPPMPHTATSSELPSNLPMPSADVRGGLTGSATFATATSAAPGVGGHSDMSFTKILKGPSLSPSGQLPGTLERLTNDDRPASQSVNGGSHVVSPVLRTSPLLPNGHAPHALASQSPLSSSASPSKAVGVTGLDMSTGFASPSPSPQTTIGLGPQSFVGDGLQISGLDTPDMAGPLLFPAQGNKDGHNATTFKFRADPTGTPVMIQSQPNRSPTKHPNSSPCPPLYSPKAVPDAMPPPVCGRSPTKQTPPRPPARDRSHDTPHLPPAPSLSPLSRDIVLTPPSKGS
ncbi:MAG: hypothetical protein M1817_001881 [Caeruleum heppii]|nr:MAG: hypothetical protein M1817_001881 [Caeruleum heppii]